MPSARITSQTATKNVIGNTRPTPLNGFAGHGLKAAQNTRAVFAPARVRAGMSAA
jgi:hypothetical protein